jgi:hypothetical protein
MLCLLSFIMLCFCFCFCFLKICIIIQWYVRSVFVCFTWKNLSLFWSLHLSVVILWCWNSMNDLKKSDLKMSSLNVRITYHIYYFTFPHCILSQTYALFIEFYYALFLFLFFIDMHYNAMIHTLCILGWTDVGSGGYILVSCDI